MHLAALEDRVTVAQQLVSAGAQCGNSAVTLAGYTPLHTACYAGRLNMARFLIGLATSNVNATTNAGFTPLHLAAQQGHSDIVYLLLEHGAEPNAMNSVSYRCVDYSIRFGLWLTSASIELINDLCF